MRRCYALTAIQQSADVQELVHAIVGIAVSVQFCFNLLKSPLGLLVTEELILAAHIHIVDAGKEILIGEGVADSEVVVGAL